MIQATISEVKNRLSGYLRMVRAGETVLIMDRKTPVATLAPCSAEIGVDPRLARLVAAGIVEPGKVAATRKLLPTTLTTEVDVVAALLEERRGGR